MVPSCEAHTSPCFSRVANGTIKKVIKCTFPSNRKLLNIKKHKGAFYVAGIIKARMRASSPQKRYINQFEILATKYDQNQ